MVRVVIGTLSVERASEVNTPEQAELENTLLLLVKKEDAADVIVTSSSYFPTKKALERFAKEINKLANCTTYIIATVGALGDDLVYAVKPNGEFRELAKQQFNVADKYNAAEGNFLKSLHRRYFKVKVEGDRELLASVLSCGEINAFQGRLAVEARHRDIEDHYSKADLIFNPTHDRMGNDGVLIAKRLHLSREIDNRQRCYVSVSNWETVNKNQTSKAETLHTVYSSNFQERNETMNYLAHNDLADNFEYRQKVVDL